jgi:thiol peroxidase
MTIEGTPPRKIVRWLPWSVLVGVTALDLLAFTGCASTSPADKPGFVYKDLPVATGTVLVGPGTTVVFKGAGTPLSGSSLKLGDVLRDAKVTKRDLSTIDLAATKGKVRIISIVPSVDTKVCEQQTHYLSEKNHGLDDHVELVTVSVDTPFAQDRFAKQAKINNVTFLSDYRSGEFGKTYGLLLEQPHVLARSVLVVDENNVIRYLQVTPDTALLPDMEAAFEAARALVSSGRRS